MSHNDILLLLTRCMLSEPDRIENPNAIIAGAGFPESGALLIGLGLRDRRAIRHLAATSPSDPRHRHNLPDAYASFLTPHRRDLDHEAYESHDYWQAMAHGQPFLVVSGPFRSLLLRFQTRWRSEQAVQAMIESRADRVRFTVRCPGLNLDMAGDTRAQ
ncbi:MAG: hypothetical protein ACOCXA_02925, partial [Planctomycetota bacterium]